MSIDVQVYASHLLSFTQYKHVSLCAGRCAAVSDGAYSWSSGTSMAVPHVAGAAARFLADHPGADPKQARTILPPPLSPAGSLLRTCMPGPGDQAPGRCAQRDPGTCGLCHCLLASEAAVSHFSMGGSS